MERMARHAFGPLACICLEGRELSENLAVRMRRACHLDI
jgi:hypothetical protein